MSEAIALTTDQLPQRLGTLKAGDRVLLSGTIYTARDAAHKRIFQLLDEGKPLPFPLKGAVIYYAGPTPGQQGMAVGACGPTTAGRMDAFAPRLLDLGLAAMIGKGGALPAGGGRHCAQRRVLLRRRGGRRRPHCPVHQKRPGHRL